jgi:hypothetical protein
MKRRFSPILWIAIVAFITQGALPCVVVCVESAGNVEVETLAGKCCYGATNSPDLSVAHLLMTPSPSEAGNSCGSCTDTPIYPASLTRPETNHSVVVDALADSTLTLGAAAIATESFVPRSFVATDVALVPVKTTTLLI